MAKTAVAAADAGPAGEPHPLQQFLENNDELIHQLIRERERLLNIFRDLSQPQSVRDQAAEEADEIQSQIDLLTAQRNAFMVGLVTATVAPSQAIVDESKKLLTRLAKVTVDANRPAALIKISTDFLTAATQILDKKVPPAAGA